MNKILVKLYKIAQPKLWNMTMWRMTYKVYSLFM